MIFPHTEFSILLNNTYIYLVVQVRKLSWWQTDPSTSTLVPLLFTYNTESWVIIYKWESDPFSPLWPPIPLRQILMLPQTLHDLIISASLIFSQHTFLQFLCFNIVAFSIPCLFSLSRIYWNFLPHTYQLLISIDTFKRSSCVLYLGCLTYLIK